MIVRTIPAPPPEFASEFAKGGWRRVERLYGARTDLIRKWVEITGADKLRAESRARRYVMGRTLKGSTT